jgi:hypothetical protein
MILMAAQAAYNRRYLYEANFNKEYSVTAVIVACARVPGADRL